MKEYATIYCVIDSAGLPSEYNVEWFDDPLDALACRAARIKQGFAAWATHCPDVIPVIEGASV